MDAYMLSRILIGTTLAFHIIYATVGVGIPVMMLIAEWIGIRKNDPHYTLMARRWARGYTVTVAVGVVTGTIVGFMLSLLYPGFMRLAGQMISLPLFMETFAFFFEAIFLGIYLYTWDRFKKPMTHFLLIIPVVIGSSASAFFITTVNAFMNSPAGFRLENGEVVDVNPIQAMFNPATPSAVFHVLTSAYMTSAFVLASIAAWFILRGKRNDYYKKALRLTMVWGLIFSFATSIAGDVSGKFLAKYQPEKLAAAEWHFETKSHAELIFGGVLDPETQEVKWAIKIPNALSILAGNSPDTVVIGLNDFPKDELPPLFVHYLFDAMVAIGSFLSALSAAYLVIMKWKKSWEWSKFFLVLIVWAGPLSMLAIEFGWIYAEIGRQPWIVRGFMKVIEATTTSTEVGEVMAMFFSLYAILGIVSTIVLIRIAKKVTVEGEAEKHGIALLKEGE